MTDPNYRVDLDVTLGRSGPPRPRAPETPFHVAILADLSGRGPADPGSGREIKGPAAIDRDDLDDVLARFKPSADVVFEEGQPPLTIRFSELEDFHPDSLYRRVSAFRELSERWQRLVHDDLFAPQDPAPSSAPAEPLSLDLRGSSLLDQVVETSAPGADASLQSRDPMQAFVAGITAPYRVAKQTPEEIQRHLDLDHAKQELLRTILHAPAIQRLEAVWRGLDFLVRRTDTGPRLKLFVFDVDKVTLANLAGTDGPGSGPTLPHVLRSASDSLGAPWSLLIGLHAFEPTESDGLLLGSLATLGSQLGAPFLGGASPALTGFGPFDSTPDAAEWQEVGEAHWEVVRRSANAAWLGLAAPRFLLREPYGPEGEACDLRGFDEAPSHEDYLWGNSALLVAHLLMGEFVQYGWNMLPGRTLNVESLPLPLRRVDGQAVATSCAECLMAESVARKISESGVMPVAWLKDQPQIRVARIQSVAAPVGSLSGPWGG